MIHAFRTYWEGRRGMGSMSTPSAPTVKEREGDTEPLAGRRDARGGHRADSRVTGCTKGAQSRQQGDRMHEGGTEPRAE